MDSSERVKRKLGYFGDEMSLGYDVGFFLGTVIGFGVISYSLFLIIKKVVKFVKKHKVVNR